MNRTQTQIHDDDHSNITPYTAGAYSLRNAVLELLQHAPHFLCETYDGALPSHEEIIALQLTEGNYDTGISLFARTCYRMPVAEHITGALTEHYQLHGSLGTNIHICLHEAIINGVIHGNLSVPGIFKSKESLADYYEWIEARLASATTSASRIQIRSSLRENALQLEVIDQGRGYLFQNYLGGDTTLEPHQGLNLIRSSCQRMKVLGCGNHILMEFEL